ncbi:unnamed protein product, partial [Polarella glacialis]
MAAQHEDPKTLGEADSAEANTVPGTSCQARGHAEEQPWHPTPPPQVRFCVQGLGLQPPSRGQGLEQQQTPQLSSSSGQLPLPEPAKLVMEAQAFLEDWRALGTQNPQSHQEAVELLTKFAGQYEADAQYTRVCDKPSGGGIWPVQAKLLLTGHWEDSPQKLLLCSLASSAPCARQRFAARASFSPAVLALASPSCCGSFSKRWAL